VCNVAGFAGIVIAASAGDDTDTKIQGILLRVVSTICWISQVMIIRKTRASANWLQIEFVTGFVNAFLTTPGIILVQYIVKHVFYESGVSEFALIQISRIQWGQCITIGAIGFSALACNTIGFQLEEAPRASIVMYLEIPLMYVAQWAVFGKGISLTELCGVVILVISVLGAAIEKLVMLRRSEKVSIIVV